MTKSEPPITFAEKILFQHYGVRLGVLLTRDFDAGYALSHNSFHDVTIRLGRYTLSVWRPNVRLF